MNKKTMTILIIVAAVVVLAVAGYLIWMYSMPASDPMMQPNSSSSPKMAADIAAYISSVKAA